MYTNNDTQPYTIRLPVEMIGKIDAIAATQGLSRADFIRGEIEGVIKATEIAAAKEKMRKASLACRKESAEINAEMKGSLGDGLTNEPWEE